jgi:hypothetical protein
VNFLSVIEHDVHVLVEACTRTRIVHAHTSAKHSPTM